MKKSSRGTKHHDIYHIMNSELISQKNMHYAKPSRIRTAISFLLGLCLASGGLYLLFLWKRGKVSDSYQVPAVVMLIVSTYTLVYVLLRISLGCYARTGDEMDFLSTFLMKNLDTVNVFAIFMLSWMLLHVIFVYENGPAHYYPPKAVQSTAGRSEPVLPDGGKGIPQRIALLYRSKNSTASIALILLFLLLGRASTLFVVHRTYYMHFKARIAQNECRMNALRTINTASSKEMDPNIKKWAADMFRIISKGKLGIVFEDFRVWFGPDAENAFALFDVDSDDQITEEEFVQAYTEVFKEKQHIENALNMRDESLLRIKVIMYVFFLISLGFAIAWLWDIPTDVGTSVTGMVAFLLPMNFIFGSVLSEMFESLIFSLFIRPFDIGDLITVDGKVYKVINFGLLYSRLELNGKIITVPNFIIRKTFVANLMLSKYTEETYILKLDYNSCRDKLDALKERITSFLVLNKKIYSEEFDVFDLEFYGYDVVQLKIVIRLITFCASLKIARKRKDMFTVFLHDVTREMGFIYPCFSERTSALHCPAPVMNTRNRASEKLVRDGLCGSSVLWEDGTRSFPAPPSLSFLFAPAHNRQLLSGPVVTVPREADCTAAGDTATEEDAVVPEEPQVLFRKLAADLKAMRSIGHNRAVAKRILACLRHSEPTLESSLSLFDSIRHHLESPVREYYEIGAVLTAAITGAPIGEELRDCRHFGDVLTELARCRTREEDGTEGRRACTGPCKEIFRKEHEVRNSIPPRTRHYRYLQQALDVLEDEKNVEAKRAAFEQLPRLIEKTSAWMLGTSFRRCFDALTLNDDNEAVALEGLKALYFRCAATFYMAVDFMNSRAATLRTRLLVIEFTSQLVDLVNSEVAEKQMIYFLCSANEALLKHNFIIHNIRCLLQKALVRVGQGSRLFAMLESQAAGDCMLQESAAGAAGPGIL
ncbi:UNVERIFIED_CONTAM: hypothetical protein PYX00_011722 [Menopon gallinae]|uniref:EF-hand domain-containing protein n=1 Tax=Menopon gallinae TaxID=328185 RepID=A0AAW2H8D6_9NEOP